MAALCDTIERTTMRAEVLSAISNAEVREDLGMYLFDHMNRQYGLSAFWFLTVR